MDYTEMNLQQLREYRDYLQLNTLMTRNAITDIKATISEIGYGHESLSQMQNAFDYGVHLLAEVKAEIKMRELELKGKA